MASQRTYIYLGTPSSGANRLITNINDAFIYLRSSLAKEKPVFEFSLDDYAHQLMALLPTGPAWDDIDDGLFNDLIYALVAEFARVSDKICVLENETFPLNTQQLLLDWERVLALPDNPDVIQGMTERRAAVAAKISTIAEPTSQFFRGLANDYGYSVEVVEYFPARVGIARVGDAINASGNEFTWAVRMPGEYQQSHRATVGDAVVGDRIATTGSGALESLLSQYKPAHTTLLFEYE